MLVTVPGAFRATYATGWSHPLPMILFLKLKRPRSRGTNETLVSALPLRMPHHRMGEHLVTVMLQ